MDIKEHELRDVSLFHVLKHGTLWLGELPKHLIMYSF